MAGAKKHMERSRRSHRSNGTYSVFGSFARKAFAANYRKEQRLSIGQKFSKLLKPAVKHTQPQEG